MKHILLALLLLVASPALSKADSAIAEAIPLETGSVPNANGPEIWTGKEGTRTVRNVTEATLTPVLPAPGQGNGTAVVVVPGGGFMTLSMDLEGWQVARWLADHGIAAFVLKYRIDPTPTAPAEFAKFVTERMSNWVGKPGEGLRIVTPPYAVEDARAALRLVRSRSAEWRVDPNRVGLMGFSAGARTTLAVVTWPSQETRPAFIVPIYPPMEACEVPSNAPPMFLAMAADDPLSGRAGFGIVESWIKARRPYEFHVYQKGGHGFGLGRPGTTSTQWGDTFLAWLDKAGLLTPKP